MSTKKFAVLHEFWQISGGLYDAIEYAEMLSKFGETTLIVYNRNNVIDFNSIINSIINNKYILDVNNLPFKIKIQFNNIIDRNKYHSALYIDSGIIDKIPLTPAKKHYIYADYITSSLKRYSQVIKLKNVYTYNEMPFFPSKVNYNFKINFNIFKLYNKLDNNTLISTKWVDNTIKHTTKIINNHTKKELEIKWPVEDFNSKFNRYEYYNINYFDPRPRIFHECCFYGIYNNNILRYIENENYDGAYYKINSLYTEGLDNRILTENDDLIQTMVN